MRKTLLLITAFLLPALAGAATLSPVQLLNPTGSTVGQAIVSTGPSTAPGWATVQAGSLTPVSANTVIANATGSTASPAAFAMPSCSTSASALNWTTNTGFTCNAGVNAAMLGGATFAAPGPIGSTTPGSGAFTTLTATGAITPSQTAGVVGTTTNNNANAGSIGEYITASGSAVSLTAGTQTNITSVSLTAGDWEVSGSLAFTPGATTTISQVAGSLSTTSAAVSGTDQNLWNLQATLTTGTKQSSAVPSQRISIAATTTVYLVAVANFATSTMTANGTIRARRVR